VLTQIRALVPMHGIFVVRSSGERAQRRPVPALACYRFLLPPVFFYPSFALDTPGIATKVLSPCQKQACRPDTASFFCGPQRLPQGRFGGLPAFIEHPINIGMRFALISAKPGAVTRRKIRKGPSKAHQYC